jgi:hypothetical protein
MSACGEGGTHIKVYTIGARYINQNFYTVLIDHFFIFTHHVNHLLQFILSL